MPDTARARTGIQAPKGSTDTVSTYDDTVKAAFDILDPLVAIDGQGILSARPVSTVGSPGTRGRYYYATDTTQLFRDTGTSWAEIPAPAKRVRATSSGLNQTIPNATFTAVTFDAEDFDASSMHNNASPSRIVCVVAGVHVVTSHVGWASAGAGSTGTRSAHLQKNGGGARLASSEFAADAMSVAHSLSAVVELAVNDYIETIVFQSQGANQDVSPDRHLAMVRVST